MEEGQERDDSPDDQGIMIDDDENEGSGRDSPPNITHCSEDRDTVALSIDTEEIHGRFLSTS